MSSEPTIEPETHYRPTDRQRAQMQLRCLSLYAQGYSIEQISEEQGITMWHARQILDRINSESRTHLLSSFVSDRIPLEVEASLSLNKILIKKCVSIMNSSKDDRVVLQAVAQLSSLAEKNQEILSSASIIAKAIKRVLVVHPPQSEEESPQSEEEEAVMLGENKNGDPPTNTSAGESPNA